MDVAVYQLTSLEDIKASGNWMWAAKLPGECAKMWKACVALRQVILLFLKTRLGGGV